MRKLQVVVCAMLFVLVAGKPAPQNVESGSVYSKLDDTTTVFVRFYFAKSSGTLDTLQLSYTFPGKKQTAYVKPMWTLWLYNRNEPGTKPQTVRVLVDDKGPAQGLELRFFEHDSQFGGDGFRGELAAETERALLGARMLEFVPPSSQTADSCKLDAEQTGKLKSFLRIAAATSRPSR